MVRLTLTKLGVVAEIHGDNLLGVGMVAFCLSLLLGAAVYTKDNDDWEFAIALVCVGTLCLFGFAAASLYARRHGLPLGAETAPEQGLVGGTGAPLPPVEKPKHNGS